MTDETSGSAICPLDIRRVMAALPHRYPMLLVDRVEKIVPDQSITAVKAVSMNEGFFQGHFPGRPIMPGVLIVEALAQAAGVLAVDRRIGCSVGPRSYGPASRGGASLPRYFLVAPRELAANATPSPARNATTGAQGWPDEPALPVLAALRYSTPPTSITA